MDQVYEIEAVRKQCLDLLRKERRTLTAGEVAMALRLPLWAVQAGLDSARTARLAFFHAGTGWGLANAVAWRPAQDDCQGGFL